MRNFICLINYLVMFVPLSAHLICAKENQSHMFPYYGLDRYFEDVELLFKHNFPMVTLFQPNLIRYISFMDYMCKYDKIMLFIKIRELSKLKFDKGVWTTYMRLLCKMACSYSAIKIIDDVVDNVCNLESDRLVQIVKDKNDKVLDHLIERKRMFQVESCETLIDIFNYGDEYVLYVQKLIKIIKTPNYILNGLQFCILNLLRNQQFGMYRIVREYQIRKLEYHSFLKLVNGFIKGLYSDDKIACLSQLSVDKSAYCEMFNEVYSNNCIHRNAWLKCAIRMGNLEISDYENYVKGDDCMEDKVFEFITVYNEL